MYVIKEHTRGLSDHLQNRGRFSHFRDKFTLKVFWEDLDEIVQGIPIREKLFIGGDLNGHVRTSRYGFDSVHEGFDFGGEK